MVISTCGFGSTGSSAICDYLLECENIVSFDNIEFTLCTQADGIEDLEFHLMKQNSRLGSGITAIQRFRKLIKNSSREWISETNITKDRISDIVNTYLNEIVQLRFVGYSPGILSQHPLIRRYLGLSLMQQRIIPKLEKKGYIKNNIDYYPLEQVECSIKPDNFYKSTRKFVRDLLTTMGCDFSKNVVLDQAFVGNDPAKSFPFFEDPYAIVVDRDPRDLYIFAKKKLLSKGRFMPTDTVENFIMYYRMMRDNQPYKQEHERILRINFEEMVYDYENATNKIDNFLNVNNVRPKTIFVPEMSAANTNLLRKFPEFEEEVEKIKRALPEYLFHFENYKEIKDNGVMFYGKSLLNKQ